MVLSVQVAQLEDHSDEEFLGPTHTSPPKQVCGPACMYVSNVFMCLCIYVCIYVSIYLCMHVTMYVYTYI